MKSYDSVHPSSDPQTRSRICSLFVTMSLISTTFFIASAWLGKDSLTVHLSPGIGYNNNTEIYTEKAKCQEPTVSNVGVDKAKDETQLEKCNDECRPVGTEALPKGILSSTSNLEMHPLSGPVSEDIKSRNRTSLLAMAVGSKQKGSVNEIVKKFLQEEFVVMLFHYDGVVDEWRELEWSDSVIHVSATNQTKWWFAKRFLHPDIVAEYDFIFLWDEDLGVENFHPGRYLSIIKEEGLEISQPALDPHGSEVHHRITIRNRRSRVHRRYYKLSSGGSGRCDGDSTAPPCVGWVEMMAPVFSRAAWRCAWHMVQNDLIHAWGLDKQLGYCAQGDRTVKVGVVDQEFLTHLALPTLGGVSEKTKTSSGPDKTNSRFAVRQRSYDEMRVFNHRWKKAVVEDRCWIDPFKQKVN